MVWPKPTEVAVLTVGGTNYQDWETVLVRHQLREQPLYFCRFTCSEGMPLAKNWAAMQIMPGYICTVTLGGILAFTGKVTTRQVFYDSKRHYIEIQCTVLNELTTGSLVHKTGEIASEKNPKTVEQMIRETLPPNIKLKVEGGSLPQDKIGPVRVQPTETLHDFYDRITRPFSKDGTGIGISFTSNPDGDFVIIVGDTGGTDAVVEGKNILEGREVIYAPQFNGEVAQATADDSKGTGGVPVISQGPGTAKKYGASVASEPWFSQAFNNLGKNFIPSVILSELPFHDKRLLQSRAVSDRNWIGEDFVTVFATVQGWMRPSGGLWTRGQWVLVTSPMLVMDGTPLKAKTVTFTQDNNAGTRTVLELVNARAEGGGVAQATPS